MSETSGVDLSPSTSHARPGHAPIELLDVGEVTVVARDTGRAATMPLATRAFADVGDLVSGVFYTSRDNGADLPGGDYRIVASGSQDVERFDVGAEAPDALDEVRVDDDPLAPGLSLEAGEPITLTWDVPEDGARASAHGGQRRRCVRPRGRRRSGDSGRGRSHSGS